MPLDAVEPAADLLRAVEGGRLVAARAGPGQPAARPDQRAGPRHQPDAGRGSRRWPSRLDFWDIMLDRQSAPLGRAAADAEPDVADR